MSNDDIQRIHARLDAMASQLASITAILGERCTNRGKEIDGVNKTVGRLEKQFAELDKRTSPGVWIAVSAGITGAALEIWHRVKTIF